MTTSLTPRLAAEALTVPLGGRTVLRGVSIEVAPGEVLGIFGPSGAGKSTLFRTLAGEETPLHGRVRIDGADVTSLPLWRRARRGLGYLPQTPSVLPDLTVAENLAVYLGLGRRDGAPLVAVDATEVAVELGLGERLGTQAGALSGGERRRLELCRALCASPSVLLCDEPFAAIDPHGAERVGARLRALADAGGAVLIADHHVAEALRLCDRAALLLEGEVALTARPDTWARHELVQEHYAPRAPAPAAEKEVSARS